MRWQGSRAELEEDFRAAAWWRDETLAAWLERNAATRGADPALVDGAGTTTYTDLAARVRTLAAGFHHFGIQRGDVVAVQLPNVAEFIVAWLALGMRGAVLQTVHMPYGPRETAGLLAHSGAVAAILPARTGDRAPAADIAALRATLPALRQVFAVGADAQGATRLDDVIAQGVARPAPAVEVQASDPFLHLYTSGTTASPKGVAVSYNHFLGNARMCAEVLGITAADRMLCVAPFTHLYGLYGFELGLSAGASACLLPMFTPPALAQALERMKPTVLLAGPAHIAACLQQGLFKGVDLSAMRIAIVSGSTVPPALSAAFENLLPNGRVLQAWGMTELQFGACSRRDDAREIRFGGIGCATPGTELRIADDGGKELPRAAPGELQVRGCSVFAGYVRNPEATRAGFTADGWFRTGDLGVMDAAGNVRLTGRLKELINRGALKINPVDVEIAIAAHPGVTQVAIAPMPDAVLGERACCFIVPRAGQTLDLDALRMYLDAQGIAKLLWPERLELVAEMPMTPTRKIQKAELVRQLLAAHPEIGQ